ncbi:nucleotidyltransferase domain-containing protein [Fibrobacterota bacterium]
MFGLPEETARILRNYFAGIPEIEMVKVYGSRAMQNYKKGSDIDFAVYSHGNEDLIGKILTELDELPTPYLFDVTDYKRLKHRELKEHIDRVGVVFFKREVENEG